MKTRIHIYTMNSGRWGWTVQRQYGSGFADAGPNGEARSARSATRDAERARELYVAAQSSSSFYSDTAN